MYIIITILAFAMFLSSCGTIQKVAVSSTSSLISSSSYELEAEGNWETFKNGVPANLKFVESLLFVSPNDDDLLLTLIKGYTGYAFAVNETEALYDKLKENGKHFHLDQAAINYSKAIKYGVRYLNEHSINYKSLAKAVRAKGGVEKLLDDEVGHSAKGDEAIFFMAQAIGGLINLRKDKMILIAQLPVVKGMVDWVCKENPDFNFGTCQIFYGGYEASRPKSLGGNPEKGKKIFLNSIKKYPENWMARAAFMQYYLVPKMKKNEFKKQIKFFDQNKDQFLNSLEWNPLRNNDKDKKVRLYKAIALKRYTIMKSLRNNIF
jgi:hypothetical protein